MILVTGANGFVGYSVVRQLLEQNQIVVATGIGASRIDLEENPVFQYEQMDFTDPFSVHDVFEKYKPDVVIHCGAMSKPDECENNQAKAYEVNVEGTIHLLVNAAEHKAFFIFLSTDFIFDGENGPYKEDDLPNPVNYYGRAKLEAEEAVKEYEHGWNIVRTVLVYGPPRPGRGNIVSVIAEKLKNKEEYRVVTDQHRTPTFVQDLAWAIVKISEEKHKGVFHISGEEMMTPYDIAIKIAHHLKLDSNLIIPAESQSLSAPAKRPPRTGFIIDKAREQLNYNPVSFMDGMEKSIG